MSPADRSLLNRLGGRPLFRCSGGWRRGDIKITTRKASELVALGALGRTTGKRGQPMMLPVSAEDASRTPHPSASPTSSPTGGEGSPRLWWLDR